VARLIKQNLLDKGYDIYPSQWIEYEDANGRGCAQPDLYIVGLGQTICVECKLTQNTAGQRQITDLYRPLLERLYQAPVLGVVAVNRLVFDPGVYSVRSLDELMKKRGTDVYTWFWLGR